MISGKQCSSEQCWLQSQVDLGMKWLPSIMSFLAIRVVPVAATGANLMASCMPKSFFERLSKIIHWLHKFSSHNDCDLIVVCKMASAKERCLPRRGGSLCTMSDTSTLGPVSTCNGVAHVKVSY